MDLPKDSIKSMCVRFGDDGDVIHLNARRTTLSDTTFENVVDYPAKDELDLTGPDLTRAEVDALSTLIGLLIARMRGRNNPLAPTR